MTYADLVALMQPGDVLDLADLLERPAWMRHAACRGLTDLFFVERGGDVRPAKAVCASCTVVDDCALYALDIGRGAVGIWGGMSERERRRLRRDAA